MNKERRDDKRLELQSRFKLFLFQSDLVLTSVCQINPSVSFNSATFQEVIRGTNPNYHVMMGNTNKGRDFSLVHRLKKFNQSVSG